MWSLFTAALARGNSTTQVQVINTSSNFVLTALLGLALFAESLPPLWWVGASLLVVGTVIVGRKDEAGSSNDAASAADSGSLPGVSREVEAEPLIYAPPPDAGRSEPAEKEDAVETDVLDLDGAVASSSSSSSGVLIDR